LGSKAKGKPVFKMPVRWEVAEMFRRDMAAAGLDFTDIDFHCLRVSYISWLVTVHGQKWRNYEKKATFYLAIPVFRDFYVL
jgi:hypothetical protein